MHHTATGGPFEEYFGLGAYVTAIKIVGLLGAQFQQAVTANTLFVLVDHIGNGKGRSARTL